jgi:hypothetical protein
MKLSMILAGILILVMAGLVLGQTSAKMPQGTKVQVQTQQTTKVNQSLKDKIAKMPLVKFDDGLQCLLKHKGELTAAYAEAANSGCTKKKTGQATLYDCGIYNSVEGAKCNAAKAKVDAIIKGCGLKDPVFKDHAAEPASGPDDIDWDAWTEEVSPGCNSLGINCVVYPG